MRAIALRGRPRSSRWGLGPQAVVVLLVLALFGAMAIEPTRQLLEQRQRISTMAEQLEGIEASNRRLEDRIDRLRDPDFLEQRARFQIGLVRPGETTYVVMPPREATRDKRRRAPDPRVRLPQPGLLEGLLSFVGVP